jgi:hypothetical protein
VTETGAAYGWGNFTAQKEAGITRRMWTTSRLNNVRPTHQEAEGQIVSIDEPFMVGGEFLDYPGDEKGSPEEVINCHCIAVALPPEQTGIGLSLGAQRFDPDQPRDDSGKWSDTGGGEGGGDNFGVDDNNKDKPPHAGGSPQFLVINHLEDHASGKEFAEVLRQNAVAEEKQVSPVIDEAAKSAGGEAKGLESAIKGEARLAQKIEAKAALYKMTRKQYAEKVGDTLRYTVLFPSDKYAAGVTQTRAALESKGFRMENKDNQWDKPGYKGLHYELVTPNGVKAEIQFHTPESEQTKKPSHKYFETLRTSKDPATKHLLNRKINVLWSAVTVPTGVFNIKMFHR